VAAIAGAAAVAATLVETIAGTVAAGSWVTAGGVLSTAGTCVDWAGATTGSGFATGVVTVSGPGIVTGAAVGGAVRALRRCPAAGAATSAAALPRACDGAVDTDESDSLRPPERVAPERTLPRVTVLGVVAAVDP
jgi:hypothetical protein